MDFRGGTFHETVIGVLEQQHHHHHDQERAPGERFTGAAYRGLTPFGEDDGELFHGREQATAELAALLDEGLDTHGMVVVTGPSGAGKTSLMRAGVLPHLDRHPLPGHPDSTRWPYAVMTPTSDPLPRWPPSSRPSSAARTRGRPGGGSPNIPNARLRSSARPCWPARPSPDGTTRTVTAWC